MAASGGKGLGWFAVRDIAAGTRIHKEVPCSVLIRSSLTQVQQYEALLEAMTAVDRERLGELAATPDTEIPTLIGRIRNNVYLVGNRLKLYFAIARINHSCDPNVRLVNDTIIAKSNIPRGSEITVSYTAERIRDQRDNVTKRRDLLRTGWGFICECSRCGVATLADRLPPVLDFDQL
jgi:hypothetical protein